MPRRAKQTPSFDEIQGLANRVGVEISLQYRVAVKFEGSELTTLVDTHQQALSWLKKVVSDLETEENRRDLRELFNKLYA